MLPTGDRFASEDQVDLGRFCGLVEHWVVLAVAVLITSCATRNFTILQLLKQPIRCTGRIDGGIAVVEIPKWFPVQDSVFEVADAALYSKMRDLPLSTRAEDAGPQTTRLHADLRGISLAGDPRGCTLTYFPWFRFLSEPVNFDAVGRVADYVADCLRFLLERNGMRAAVDIDIAGDSRHVRAAGGLDIEVVGTQALRSLALSHGSIRSFFDLDSKRLEIDRRMFPAAFEAGRQLLETPDRLINVDIAIDGDCLRLTAAEGDANVQA